MQTMQVSVLPENQNTSRWLVATTVAKAAVVSEQVFNDIRLATGEVFSDCFLHGDDFSANVQVCAGVHEVRVFIVSESTVEKAKDIETAFDAAPCDPATAECGRGIHMLKMLAKEVGFTDGRFKLTFDARTRAIVPVS